MKSRFPRRATDEYGLNGGVTLHYSVNGGPDVPGGSAGAQKGVKEADGNDHDFAGRFQDGSGRCSESVCDCEGDVNAEAHTDMIFIQG